MGEIYSYIKIGLEAVLIIALVCAGFTGLVGFPMFLLNILSEFFSALIKIHKKEVFYGYRMAINILFSCIFSGPGLFLFILFIIGLYVLGGSISYISSLVSKL